MKNYIGEINYFETNLIEGSRKGYRIQRERGRELLGKQQQASLPETPGERVNYMIAQLLTNDSENGGGIDLYDISEEPRPSTTPMIAHQGTFASLRKIEIGRASCRERVCQYV